MDPFRSKRLSYGAYNSPEHNEFFHSLQSEPLAFVSSCATLLRPVDRKFVDDVRKDLLENSLLFVIIYKVAENPNVSKGRVFSSEGETGENSTNNSNDRIPIGSIFLKAESSDMRHHCCSELGVDIIKEYQGHGYGSEAINWVLDWAFRQAGLHRVELSVLGWNNRAKKLYEKLGFREEGRRRECFFKDDEWWDELHMGILKKEWAQLRAQGSR
jgi:GNAT superfamily N-acetyltransferase